MTKSKLVSIVIPVFNNGNEIQETINSIRNQTYQNWEAIFVDDGSEDQTESIIKNNIEQDARLFYIHRNREPKGGSTCRNIGLKEAKGDYIIFLDGDDLLSETCLEKRLETIKNTDYDFVVFPMATFQGSLDNCHKITRKDVKNCDYYYMTGSAVWQVTSPLYRKSFLLKLNGFDERFLRFQDVELGLRATALSNGNFLSFCDRLPDCYYRIPEKGPALSPKKLRGGLESYKYLLSEIKKLKEKGFLRNRYYYSLGLLATYSNILHVIDILKERGEDVRTFEEYNKVDLRQTMLFHHRLILFLLIKIKLPLDMHLKIVHLCDKYCRFHFLRH